MASMPNLVVNVAEGTVIRPGDKVLVCLGRDLTPEVAEVFREQWAERMPGVELVVVGAESMAVQRAS